MSTRFQDKLKEIRDAGTRRTAESRQARSQEDMQRSLRTMESLDFREKVEAVVSDLAHNFVAEAPSFELHRGFFEGKYLLALRSSDETPAEGRPRHDDEFSRLVFLLSPDSRSGTFEVECRKTVRNRDLETLVHSEDMVAESLEALGHFVEEQFLAFAGTYFGESSLAPTGGGEA